MKIWRIGCGRTSAHIKFSPSFIEAGPDLTTANFYAPSKTTASKCFKHHLPLIVAAIDNALPGGFQAIDCGTFTRKK
jgi:hypothetical protein